MIEFTATVDTQELRAIFEKMQKNMTRTMRQNISRDMASGILRNHATLARGGSVKKVTGGTVKWSMQRHPFTLLAYKIRGIKPSGILHFTGKLQQGLESGTVDITPSGAVWRPGKGVGRLIEVHQEGLAPLAGGGKLFRNLSIKHGVSIGNLPERPIVFWSDDMARQVLRRMKSALEFEE